MKNSQDEYTITVDYQKSVEELVADTVCDSRDRRFKSKNFALSDRATITFELAHWDHVPLTEEVHNHLKGSGLRPATVKEFLAWAATNPKVEDRVRVLATGSSWLGPGEQELTPVYARDGQVSVLAFICLDEAAAAATSPVHICFLVVREDGC